MIGHVLYLYRHMNTTSNKSKTLRDVNKFNTVLFLCFLPHEQVPFDDRRLLFPPGPAAVLISAAYAIYLMLFPDWMAPLVLAGMIAGE